MALDGARREALLERLAVETDAARLRVWVDNLNQQGETELGDIARRRLYVLGVAHPPGSLEFDMWVSIHALEDALLAERGRTTRLTRTRQKIGRDGEHKTMVDVVTAKEPAAGFAMLVERGMTDLLFEAVALRHADRFDETVLAAARLRMEQAAAPLAEKAV